MDETRISEAAATIAKRKTALKWLEQYGRQLDGRNKDHADVHVQLSLAGACHGAKEAAEVLSAYARLCLPDVVKAAIECCNNDIAIATDTIRNQVMDATDK